MPTISLCMIVKNEEEHLEQCLSSVKSIVDEIIIVDTGSTDKTKEIAKKFNAIMIEHKWNNDFSEARNVSLKHATGDWILMLDADEVIAEKDLEKIKELTKHADVDGFSLIQRNYTNDANVVDWQKSDEYEEAKGIPGYFPSPLVRLFKNKKTIFLEGKIHEVVESSIRKFNGSIMKTDIPIHHYGHCDNEIKEQKRDMYLEIGLKEIEKNPNSPKPYFDVGLIYQKQNKLGEAIKSFEKSIELNPKQPFAHTNLGSSYFMLGLVNKAINAFKTAIKNDKMDAGAYANLAMVYIRQNRLDLAADVLEKALRLSIKDPELFNNAAVLFTHLQDYEKAIEYFKKALELNPRKEGALRNLGVVYFKLKNYPEAENAFKEIIKIEPDNAKAYANLGVVHLSQNKVKDAINAFNKTIELDNKNFDAYNNLGCIYENKKDFRKAIECFSKAIELNHPNKENIVMKVEQLKKQR